MTTALARLALIASLPVLSSGHAAAQTLDGIVRAELLSGWQAEDGRHIAGLRLTLAPGWKTYWRAPGDAGIPPLFDWSGSRNVASVGVQYPAPEAFDQNGMRSIGYSGRVVWPLAVTPGGDGPVFLDGRIDIGVCRDVCVPVSLSVAADITAGVPGRAAIEQALAERPISAAAAGVRHVGCRLDPIEDGLRLTAEIRVPGLSGTEVVVVEAGDPGIWVSDAEARVGADGLTATADLVAATGSPFVLARGDLRLTVLGTSRAIDIRGCSAE